MRTVPDAVTERLSDLGNIQVAVPVLALAMAYSVRRSRAWAPALTAGLAMALVPALIVPLKEWRARPRAPGARAGGRAPPRPPPP
ncbi:phosphoesterase, partial [Streptomyces goshikiensis]